MGSSAAPQILDESLKQVASAAGFGSIDVMRRAFIRVLGMSPRRYRKFALQSDRS
jgi:transcriptional regulator GlxA family with amidase domain